MSGLKSSRSEGAARRSLLRIAGIALFLAAWQAATSFELLGPVFGPAFGPGAGGRALLAMARSGVLFEQTEASLGRFGLGLLLAVVIGGPLGFIVGYFRSLEELTTVVFQILRMTSPLALVPIALIAFGVGSRPVVFLIAYAAVWPVVLSTAHGVSRVSPAWKRMVRGFGARDGSVLRKVIVPAALPELVQGIRLAVGVGWIVLVPAEMLGVDSGLGYQILDSRDRFAYDELVATILVIGLLGLALDLVLRRLKELVSWTA